MTREEIIKEINDIAEKAEKYDELLKEVEALKDENLKLKNQILRLKMDAILN